MQRKNKGKQRMKQYEAILINSGFNAFELELVELEESDKIIEKIKSKFVNSNRETELLDDGSLFIDSELMRAVYLNLDKNATCYIYTDDFQYCGMFVVNAKRGFEIAFSVAKNDYQNTCFILDMDLKYSFLIDYNDGNDSGNPYTFDIQLSKSPE